MKLDRFDTAGEVGMEVAAGGEVVVILVGRKEEEDDEVGDGFWAIAQTGTKPDGPDTMMVVQAVRHLSAIRSIATACAREVWSCS